MPLRGPSPLFASPDAFMNDAVIIPVCTRAMLPSVAERICWNCDAASASTSAGFPSTSPRSGLLGFVTSRSQPATTAINPAAVRDRRNRICRSPLRMRSEGRAEHERERAQLREREGIDGVDQAAARLSARAANTDLRIEAGVIGPGLDVPADQADRPVTEAADLTDVVRCRDLAQLDEARVLCRPVVRRKDVVEAADTVVVAAGSGACTVEVADRLRRLDAGVALIDLVAEEVQVGPVPALVPHVTPERAFDQTVHRQTSVLDRVRHADAIVRQRIADRQTQRRAVLVADQDRHAPRRL